MVKLRKSRRRILYRNVRIELSDGSTIDCALSDISAGGARILIGNTTGIPDEFTLILRYDLRRRCRAVHRTRHRLGVMFVARINPFA